MVDRQDADGRVREPEADREADTEDLQETARKESRPTNVGQPSRKEDEAAKKRRPWLRIVLILVAIALVIGGVLWWLATKDQESTDDAYTDGRAVTIAAHVSGYVVALNVNDNQFVHKGDVLLEIDPRDYIASRDQAQGTVASVHGQLLASQYASEVARKNFPAQLTQAQAQLANAKGVLFKAQTDYNRQHAVARAATTQAEVDASTAALQQAQAQVAQAEAAVTQATPVQQNIGQVDARVEELQGQLTQAQAQLDQANLNLGWTKVVAPQDGWITKRNVEMGNFVQSGQSLFSLVTPEVWVVANFKETQLDRMRPGQKVKIDVDAYPSLDLEGHVDSIQLGSGSKFSAFPAENATGNFVKIVQRVPVKIIIDKGLDPKLPLPLGLSVTPKVALK